MKALRPLPRASPTGAGPEPSGSRRGIAVALPLALALALRLYPFFASGLPFSVDAWPSVACAERLLGGSPGWLGTEKLGDCLFGAVSSVLVGADPGATMGFFLPLVGAASTLALYALTRAVYGGRVAPLAASLFSAAFFTEALLTAGVKGETYARFQSLVLVLVFARGSLGLPLRLLLFSLLGSSLVLAHCYTALLVTASLASAAVGMAVVRWRRGLEPGASDLLLPALLGLQVSVYSLLHAGQLLDLLSHVDVLSALSYQLLFFALALGIALGRPLRGAGAVLASAVAASTAALLALAASEEPLVLGAPILPRHYLVYAAPFALCALLGVLAHGEVSGARGGLRPLAVLWLAPVLGLEAYAVFGNAPPGVGVLLAYRGLNHLVPPLSILGALGLAGLLEGRSGAPRSAARAIALAVLVAALAVNAYAFYATVHGLERYTGYFWLNRPPDYHAGLWLSERYGGVVAGDAKFSYLLEHYFGLGVDEFAGLLYLSGRSGLGGRLLVLYDQVLRNGYVVPPGYGADLPEGWEPRLDRLDLVYSSGYVWVYRGSG